MLFLQQLILHQNTRASTPAVISDQVTLTYAQLTVLIQHGAGYLQENGIKVGQVVGICIADEVVFGAGNTIAAHFKKGR